MRTFTRDSAFNIKEPRRKSIFQIVLDPDKPESEQITDPLAEEFLPEHKESILFAHESTQGEAVASERTYDLLMDKPGPGIGEELYLSEYVSVKITQLRDALEIKEKNRRGKGVLLVEITVGIRIH